MWKLEDTTPKAALDVALRWGRNLELLQTGPAHTYSDVEVQGTSFLRSKQTKPGALFLYSCEPPFFFIKPCGSKSDRILVI